MLACFFLSGTGNLLPGYAARGQTVQTGKMVTSDSSDKDVPQDDDFMMALLFIGALAGVFILMCVGAGIVLTALILFILFGLTVAGVLSVAILVGINQRSFTSAFKTFLITTTTIGGLAIGLVVFWMINRVSHWWSLMATLTIGSVSGLLAGLLLGILSFYTIKKLSTWFKNKLQTT